MKSFVLSLELSCREWKAVVGEQADQIAAALDGGRAVLGIEAPAPFHQLSPGLRTALVDGKRPFSCLWHAANAERGGLGAQAEEAASAAH